MKFFAELKKVQSTKKGLDMVYQINLVTEDPSTLSLGSLPADTLFKVDIEVNE